MFYTGPQMRVGTRVARFDNPTQEGRVAALFGTAPQAITPAYQASIVYRVVWDCGWREDCDRGELELV